ncbi:MAG: hypothetical protein ACTSPA_08145 [Promethearchaeota archaeon]
MARKKKKKKEKSSSDTHEQTKELLAMLHETEDTGTVQQMFTETSEIDNNLVQSPPPPPPPPIESSTPSPIAQEESKKEEKTTSTFFKDTGVFFSQLGEAYEARYSLWEKSDLTLMAILREIRKINEDNTEQFVKAIENLDKKIIKGFDEFLVKRTELERYSDTDYKEIAKNFQKTLDLLNFQIREFKLNQMVTEMFNIYSK